MSIKEDTMAQITIGQAPASAGSGTGFLEWGPVFAGGAMAAALTFVLLSFGSTIGLSFGSPWSSAGSPVWLIVSLAIFWAIAAQIGAAIAGGYVAGRMRSSWGEETHHEVEFRDGLHGGLVWAVGVIVAAGLLVSAAGAVARSGADLAGRVAGSRADTSMLSADLLLRPAGKDVSTQGAANTELRGEISRLLGTSLVMGTLSDADRDYLAGIVSQRTSVAPADAAKRVNDTFAQAIAVAKDTTDKARRTGILTGLVTAMSLLISLAAAWWAAQRGGYHRDNAIPAAFPIGKRTRAAA